MTLLTKNSFLDEIRKQYVTTARAKGLTERQVLYGHVFRNAMLLVISGFPGAFLGAFFAGSLLIETVFSLDGLGYLTYKAALDRDYPIVFANALHLHAGGPRRRADLRPDVYLDRSAHRFRTAGRLGHGAVQADRTEPAALGTLQAEPARLLVLLDLHGALPCLRLRALPGERPPDAGVLQGRAAVSDLHGLSGIQVRRLPGAHGFPRPGEPGRDRRQWLDDLAADPLLLQHRQQRTAAARTFAAGLQPDAGRSLRQVSRSGWRIRTAPSATSTGWAPTTRAATWWPGWSMASASRWPSA